MPDNPSDPNEPASNRLAAFLRDCLLGLLALAMIGWLAYFGIIGVATRHLDLSHGSIPSDRWFDKPLDGLPAVLAGFSFLSLAAAFASVCAAYSRIGNRLPSWMRSVCWWFVAGWALLYFSARLISRA